MKFEFLFEDMKSDMAMDEARGASDVQFDKFAKSAGTEIADACNHVVTRIYAMPGFQSYKEYVTGIPSVDVTDPVSLVLSIDRYYEGWINQLPKKKSDEIHRATKSWLAQYKAKGTPGRKLGGKNKPKDDANKATQGLDYTPGEPEVAVEPEVPVEPEVAVEPEVPAEPRRGRGRPPLPPEQRKTQVYVPTGKPKGRPKTKELTMGEVMAQMRAMQAEIKALKDQLNKGGADQGDDIEPQLAEMNESLQYLRKQYMRFL